MIAHSKNELRKEMLKKRDSLSKVEREEKSAMIKERLFALEEFKKAKTIAFYISKGSEVNTYEMIANAIKLRKEVIVPVTNNEIKFYKFTSFDNLAPGKFNVLEPKTKITTKHEPDVVIIPGLAFDSDFHHLGYGKGYYDRALKKFQDSIRIGICFDFQLVEKIQKHEHDEMLHIIVSERRLLLCSDHCTRI